MSNQVGVSHRNSPRALGQEHGDSQGVRSGAGLLQRMGSSAGGEQFYTSTRCRHRQRSHPAFFTRQAKACDTYLSKVVLTSVRRWRKVDTFAGSAKSLQPTQ